MSSNGHNLLDIKVYITMRPHEEIVKLVITAIKLPSLVIPIWECDEARLLATMLLLLLPTNGDRYGERAGERARRAGGVRQTWRVA